MVTAIAQWESNMNPSVPGDNGSSIGLFQLNMAGGKGTGFTAAELSDPILNVSIAADYLTRLAAEGLAAGGPEEAARRMILDRGGQNPKRGTPESAAAVQRYLDTVSRSGGGGQVSMQASQAGQGTAPSNAINWPKLEDFTTTVTTDAYGNTAQQTDWSAYMTALGDVVMAYVGANVPLPADAPQMAKMVYDTLSSQKQSEATAQRRSDLASFIDTSISALASDVASRRLSLDEAQQEFDRHLKAADFATKAWETALEYSLPPGAEYVPGFEPAGVATEVGMEPWKASPVRYNPFETANQIVSGTPTLTDIGAPDYGNNLFQQALSLVQSGGAAPQQPQQSTIPTVSSPPPGVPQGTPDFITRNAVPVVPQTRDPRLSRASPADIAWATRNR